MTIVGSTWLSILRTFGAIKQSVFKVATFQNGNHRSVAKGKRVASRSFIAKLYTPIFICKKLVTFIHSLIHHNVIILKLLLDTVGCKKNLSYLIYFQGIVCITWNYFFYYGEWLFLGCVLTHRTTCEYTGYQN